jgi:RHS repeat-associated protein
LTDNTGAVLERYSYDPWGKRRDATTWASAAPGTFAIDPAYTDRGFTGHEHVEHVGLVNMNGRIYDPELGKFLSADPTTQFPESTQGWNRYAYTGNNPLSHTDPSGFSFLKTLMQVVGIVLNFIPGVGQFASAAWYNAMLVGFATGFLASGGNLRAGLIGALGGALFFKIGFIADDTLRVLAHGLAGGGLSELGGGTFKAGLFAGVAGSAGGLGSRRWFGNPGTGGVPGTIKRTLTAAIAGGAGSVAGGGKFQNGAKSAAFAHLLNDELPAHAPSLWEALRRNTSLQVGVGAGLESKIGFLGGHLKAGLGSATVNYKVNAMFEDEGSYDMSGPSLGVGLGGSKEAFSPNLELINGKRISQIFDSDLGSTKSWREEVSDGSFVYKMERGDPVPIRAESEYKISIDVTLIAVHVKLESDVFRALYESK